MFAAAKRDDRTPLSVSKIPIKCLQDRTNLEQLHAVVAEQHHAAVAGEEVEVKTPNSFARAEMVG